MISLPPPQWSWQCKSCQRCPARPSTRWSSCCSTPPTTLFSLLCSPLKMISLGDHLGPFETSRTGRSHFSPPLIHPSLAFDRTLTNSRPKTRKPSPRLHFDSSIFPSGWVGVAIDRQVFSATKESLESPDVPLAGWTCPLSLCLVELYCNTRPGAIQLCWTDNCFPGL